MPECQRRRVQPIPAVSHADTLFERTTGPVERVTDAPEPSRGQGVLRAVDTLKGEVEIEHDDIPGLMPSMTMNFEVVDRELLEGLSPGQTVDFRVEHSGGRYRILEIAPNR